MKFLNPETPDDGGHKRNERHYWQALATEMNISETCFLTLRPGATKGQMSPLSICNVFSSIFHRVGHFVPSSSISSPSFYLRPSYDYEIDDYLLQVSRGNPILVSDGSPRQMKWATSRAKRGTSPPGESRCLTLSNPCFTCPMTHL